ncbi:MAG: HepT-like ribonuclease domain-containing protein [Thermomicrobiales bacterium]
MRSDQERLNDIRAAVEQIEKYTVTGRSAFDGNGLIRSWVLHRLMIIGEAARGLSAEFRAAHAEVEWWQMIAMRNFLIHAYFGVDPDEVWATVERDVPVLKRAVATLIGATGEAEATNG